LRIFTYSPKNSFAKKTYIVEKKTESKTSVKAKSPFLGEWQFVIDLPLLDLTKKLEVYCEGKKSIQDVFSTLDPQTRDLFMADPGIYEKTTNYD
jgi:hypothetical protein